MNIFKKNIKRTVGPILVVLLLCCSSLAMGQAQQQIVSGNVTSLDDGFPLPGVTIILKGTTQGTSSDFDGNYSMNVPAGGVLVFSYVGFKTTELAVNGRTTLNVAMETSAESLDEVVVTALGIKREEKSLG